MNRHGYAASPPPLITAVIGAVLGVVIGVLAAIVPARQASRLDVLSALTHQ